MSNKSVEVALGRAVKERDREREEKKRKKKYETEKERNGSKKDSKKRKENKCGLWKGMVQGIVNKSDIEGP